MNKKIIIGVIVGIVIALAVLLWQTSREEQSHNKQYEKMEKELLPLNVEKRNLQQEIVDLKEMYEKEGASKGTATVLFTEMNEKVYTNAYPAMQEKGYVGVLALSSTQLPGMEGCISIQEFKALIAAGWSYCLTWEENTVAKDWLSKHSMEPATVMYFTDETYQEEYDIELSAAGYSTVVRYNNEEMTTTPPTRETGIWHADVCGMQGNRPMYQLENAMTQGGNIVFSVGFTRAEELYDEEIFGYMLEWFKDYEEAGTLVVSDFAGARAYHEEMEWKRNLSEEQFQVEKAKIEEKIKETEKKIDAVYSKYE